MVECPECGSTNIISEWDDRRSSEYYCITHHTCENCGCEFDTEECTKITKHSEKL